MRPFKFEKVPVFPSQEGCLREEKTQTKENKAQ
jgi:hypothetical protein